MSMTFRFFSFSAALILAGFGSQVRAAYFDDFNSPTYSTSSLILPGQNGWTSSSGTSGYPIYADFDPFTNPEGKLYVEHRAAGAVREATKTITTIGPGGDGKIYIHVDSYMNPDYVNQVGVGALPATLMSHLMFRDSTNKELVRFDVKPSGIRGRTQGGNVGQTNYVQVDSPNASQRTIWAVVDTTFSTGGVGGSINFYADSIAPGNLLNTALNDITYPSDRLDSISQIWVDSTSSASDPNYVYMDNISIDSVVPEPGTLAFLILGAIPLARRKRIAG